MEIFPHLQAPLLYSRSYGILTLKGVIVLVDGRPSLCFDRFFSMMSANSSPPIL